jgi:hypothetical protein
MKCMSVPPKGSSESEFLSPSAWVRQLVPHGLAASVVPQLRNPNHLPRRAPDALEEAILLCEPVEAVVALAHGAHEAAEGVDLIVAGVAAVLVNLADADLDGGVVLGLDDASGGRLEGISIAIGSSFGSSKHSRICGGRKLGDMLAFMSCEERVVHFAGSHNVVCPSAR